MAKTNYSKLSDADLERGQQHLASERETLRTAGLAIAAELDRRAVAKRIASFTDAERAALAQHIAAEGIESGEASGTPGH